MFKNCASFLYLLLLFFAASYRCELLEADCELTVPRLGFFAPLVYWPNGTLLEAQANVLDEGYALTIPHGDHIRLSCAPGYFRNFNNEKSIRVICNSGNRISVNRVEERWPKDFGCEVRTIEEIIKPVEGCPSNLQTSVFGYENPIKEKSIVIGETCYSEEEGRTLFVHTKIAGASTPVSNHIKTEPVNYFNQKHPESRHKLNFLLATNVGVLQPALSRKLGDDYILELETSHFIDTPIIQNQQLNSIEKLGWNYYMSPLVPNWNLLLNDISHLGDGNYDLYSGTHGVLSVHGKNDDVPIYLKEDEDKYQVPKYLWAVVKTENKAVAFAVYTKWEATQDELVKDKVCESKCSQISWLKKTLPDEPQNGYIWCCDVQSFATKINEMPTLPNKYALLS